MEHALKLATAAIGDVALTKLTVFKNATAAIVSPFITGTLAYNKGKTYRRKRNID